MEEIIDLEVNNTTLPNWVTTHLAKNKRMMEEISKETTAFDDHPVTLQNASYDKSNKNLKIERVKVQNKRVIDQNQMDIYGIYVGATGVMKLYQTIEEALAHYVMEQEAKNLGLQKRIREL